MTINRQGVRPVSLPSETVPVPEIGGEVNIFGMDMPQMLEFMAERRRLAVPREGETEGQATERAVGALLPQVLHWCVLLDDGTSPYSLKDWRVFGRLHMPAAMSLFKRVMDLSGSSIEAEKNG
jgi:hypothetical protein